MTVYLDLENIVQLLSKIDAYPKGEDVIRFIKKQLNVHLNFLLDSLPEEIYILLEEFMDGVSADFQFTHSINKISPRPITMDSLKDSSGVYLLNDENTAKVKDKYSFLIGSPGEEMEILEQLIIDAKDYGFHDQKVIGSAEFDNWYKIEPYCLPFSTLLIVDRYMFKGSQTAGNLSLFEFNLGCILSKFFEHKKAKARLIFVYQINPFVPLGNINYDSGPEIDHLKQQIIKSVKKLNKHCPSPEIFFIAVPKDRIDAEHDRHIISNYIRFKSGDSLIYFNSRGLKATQSNDFDIYSLGRRKYHENATSLLAVVNQIIIETIDKYPHRCNLEDGVAKEKILNFN
jgi:hypothetical protein